MHGVRVDEENGEDGCWQTVTRALVVAAIMATEKSMLKDVTALIIFLLLSQLAIPSAGSA